MKLSGCSVKTTLRFNDTRYYTIASCNWKPDTSVEFVGSERSHPSFKGVRERPTKRPNITLVDALEGGYPALNTSARTRSLLTR